MDPKELLTVEFRYRDEADGAECTYRTKTVTIGIYDTLEAAIAVGNECIDEVLSKYFEVRYDDHLFKSWLFGAPKRMASNTCYTTKGINYIMRVTKLEFTPLEDTIKECFAAYDRYAEYKKKMEDEDD